MYIHVVNMNTNLQVKTSLCCPLQKLKFLENFFNTVLQEHKVYLP